MNMVKDMTPYREALEALEGRYVTEMTHGRKACFRCYRHDGHDDACPVALLRSLVEQHERGVEGWIMDDEDLSDGGPYWEVFARRQALEDVCAHPKPALLIPMEEPAP